MRLAALALFSASCVVLTSCSHQPVPSVWMKPEMKYAVLSEYDMKTDDWVEYSNSRLGFAFRHPAFYTVREEGDEVIVARYLNTTDQDIRIRVVRSTVVKEVSKDFYRIIQLNTHSGRLNNSSTHYTVASYSTGELYSKWSMYYLTRDEDMPQTYDRIETLPEYDVVLAEVHGIFTEAELQEALNIDQADRLLSVPDQILSTFRFL